MKKLMLMLAILASTGGLFAQKSAPQKIRPHFYQQGEWMLSISPGIGWLTKASTQHTNHLLARLSVNSRLTAGRFMKDRWLLAASGVYRGAPFAGFHTYYYEVGALTRYYLGKRKISPFVEANVGYFNQMAPQRPCLTCPTDRLGGVYAGGRVGVAFRFGKLGFESSWGLAKRFIHDFPAANSVSPKLRAAINYHF